MRRSNLAALSLGAVALMVFVSSRFHVRSSPETIVVLSVKAGADDAIGAPAAHHGAGVGSEAAKGDQPLGNIHRDKATIAPPPVQPAQDIGGQGNHGGRLSPTLQPNNAVQWGGRRQLFDLWKLQVASEDNCTNAVAIMDQLFGSDSRFNIGDGDSVSSAEVARLCAGRTYGEWIRHVYNDVGVRSVDTEKGGHLHFGCTAESAQCLYRVAMCGYDAPPCDVDHLMEMFANVAAILDSLMEIYPELEWTLYAGTLLGSVREGRHMAHETDIDLGVYAGTRAKEVMADLTTAIKRAGLPYRVDPVESEKDLLLVRRVFYSATNNLHIDLWFYEKNDQRNRVDILASFELEFFCHSYAGWYPIERRCTYGPLTGLPCPREPDIQLTELYGEDWRIPYKKQENPRLANPRSCRDTLLHSTVWEQLNDGIGGHHGRALTASQTSVPDNSVTD